MIRVCLPGKLKHAELDERALDALKEFSANDAIQVLKQVVESNLGHVTNKSAYLCGQMKTYRQKMKSGGANAAPKGPDEAKLKVGIIMAIETNRVHGPVILSCLIQ